MPGQAGTEARGRVGGARGGGGCPQPRGLHEEGRFQEWRPLPGRGCRFLGLGELASGHLLPGCSGRCTPQLPSWKPRVGTIEAVAMFSEQVENWEGGRAAVKL